MKHRILLVDAERRSVRVLSVALRSAGYSVRVAGSGLQALDKIEAAIPDVIVSDSQLPKLDGYGLVEKLKANPETENIPILLLTSKGTAEDRERGRGLGVADYLPKPVFVRELLACIGLLIARSARAKMAASITTTRTGRFSGSTRDVSVVDLLQTFELLRESGVARLLRGAEGAEIYFRDGRAVDARLGRLRGEQAIYAALLWSEAALDVEFKSVKKEDVIDRSIGTLLVEGMRRVDAWGHIYEQLRPLTNAVETDQARLLEQIASRLSDGKALSAERGNALLQGLGDSAVVATDSSLVSQRAVAMHDEEEEDEDNEDEEYDENANDDDDDQDESDEADDADRARDEVRDPEDGTSSDEAVHEAATSVVQPVPPDPVVSIAAAPPSTPTPIYEGATITLRAPAPSRAQTVPASPVEGSHAAPSARSEAPAAPPPSIRSDGQETPAQTNGHTPASQTNGHGGLAHAGTTAGATKEIALRPSAPTATTAPQDLTRESPSNKNGEEPLALARPATSVERAVVSKPVVTIPAATAEKLAAPVARTERLGVLAPDAAKLGAMMAEAAKEKAAVSEANATLRPINGVKTAFSAAASLPSTPPWTHEVDSDNEPAPDADGPIPGVSAPFGRTGRILIGAGVALALVIGVVTGLRPSGSHARTADEARKGEAVSAAAAAARVEAPPPPAAAAPAEALAAAPAATTTDPSAPPAATDSTAAAANAVAAPAAPAGEPMAPGLGTDPAPAAGAEFHPVHHSPLVAQAEQALIKGATDRAIVLAGQAVAATPTDAAAWLALGAAHRAAGDESAARADYRSCIAQAHSEGVNHCRVLAEH